MLMNSSKCPGFSGLIISVKFCTPRGGMSSSRVISTNGMFSVVWMSVKLSSPKLKS